MTYFTGSELRFGRRGVAPPRTEVDAEDVRRGVEAIATLSRAHRHDPAARSACLFYALRSRADRLSVEALVRAVETRIAAFEFMLANRPHLITRQSATAAFENEVYEAIATEPLIVMNGRMRFEETRFIARVERRTARSGTRASAEPRQAS